MVDLSQAKDLHSGLCSKAFLLTLADADMKMARKKMDMSMRLRSGSHTFKSIPEEPSETAIDVVFKEMGTVLSGLAEFKTELLQLHAAVSLYL